MKIKAFESMWLNAEPPPLPTNNFPSRIEGLSPSIWHSLYKKESNNYHAPTESCLLCNKVDKIIYETTKCHKFALSPDCPNCQEKCNNAKYLNRTWLSDVHIKNLNTLTHAKIGGEIKSFRAEAWSDKKNNNKANEPLKTQMERELSRFSRSKEPIPLQAWIPDLNQPRTNKTIQPAQTNLHTKGDNELNQEIVPLIPDKKPSTEDINLIAIKEPEIMKSVNEEDPKDPDIEAPQESADKILAVVKEISERTPLIIETQLQPEDIEDSPTSYGDDLQDIAWIDADDEDPWEHGMDLGPIYDI